MSTVSRVPPHGRDLLDVFEEHLVVCGFGHQNERHPLVFACGDERLDGVKPVTDSHNMAPGRPCHSILAYFGHKTL